MMTAVLFITAIFMSRWVRGPDRVLGRLDEIDNFYTRPGDYYTADDYGDVYGPAML